MVSIKISKNNLFFIFLIFGYIFGVIFYDFIEFKYTDELMAVFLVLFTGLILWERRGWNQAKPLYTIFGVLVFYIIYSFVIKSNVTIAILKDSIIQIKPFLGFYCTYLLMPSLTKDQKKIITIMCIISALFMIIVGLTDSMYIIFGHQSRFATAATITAFLFFYCSSYRWSDIITFFTIFAVGFISTRSKFYGFYTLTIILCTMIKSGYKLKYSLSGILIMTIVVILIIMVAWEKIYMYFIFGTMGNGETWARPALFITSFFIFIDYFPFGSGLASFATYESAEYYSPLYAEYKLNHLFGLSKEYPHFICDTYYPSLAQFGLVGVCLFIFFWILIIKKIKNYKAIIGLGKEYIISILIICFFAIESFADSTFTHNRGLFMLIIMGMTLSDMHYKANTGLIEEKANEKK